MLLDNKTIAVKTAVFIFFITSIICIISEMEPFSCCKKALIASAAAYIASVIFTKIVNAIIISAAVEKYMKQEKAKPNDS